MNAMKKLTKERDQILVTLETNNPEYQRLLKLNSALAVLQEVLPEAMHDSAVGHMKTLGKAVGKGNGHAKNGNGHAKAQRNGVRAIDIIKPLLSTTKPVPREVLIQKLEGSKIPLGKSAAHVVGILVAGMIRNKHAKETAKGLVLS